MELEGKTVVITGASRGMGQRLAVRLGRERANVVVNFKKDAASADRTVKEVLAAGGEAVAIQADIAEPEAVANLVSGAVDRFGSIDVRRGERRRQRLQAPVGDPQQAHRQDHGHHRGRLPRARPGRASPTCPQAAG